MKARFRAKYFFVAWGFQPMNHQFGSDYRQGADATLENDHGIAYGNDVLHSRGVPVGQSNAAMAGGPTDCFRIVGPVNADTWLVQAHPKDTDQIVRARREIEIFFSANAVIEHPFVVAKPGP